MRAEPRLEYLGDVYKPSDDTWLLLGVLEGSSAHGDTCVDLGCGSGVLGIYALLNSRCKRVVFIDVQDDAVKTTSVNVALNGVAAFSVVIQSDACDPLPIRPSSVDIVLANPPYLPAEDHAARDEAVNGGVEGYEKALCFIRASTSILRQCGRLYLVYSSLSKPSIIRSQLERLGYTVTLERTRNFFFETLTALEGVLTRESQSCTSRN